jgi:hypothetical protein
MKTSRKCHILKQQRGVAIFAKACFGHPSPSKQQKLNATANAFGAPDVLRTCHFATTIDHGLKIFTSLKLRFQDFQRWCKRQRIARREWLLLVESDSTEFRIHIS